MLFLFRPRVLASWVLAGSALSALAAPPAVGAALARAAKPIFVLNSLDANISVIDPVTFTEIKRIPTGKEPHHLYLTPDDKSLVVANALGDSLTFVNPVTAEVQRVINGISDPYHLRFSPDMKWFVTAANRLDHVSIYRWVPADANNPFQLVKRIAAPKTPSHLYIDTKSTVLYVSLQDSDELLAVDLATQTPRWKVKVGPMPADIFLAPDDKHILVALTGAKEVEVYDVSNPAVPAKLVKRIASGKGAHSFRNWGDGRHVLVSNRAGNTISKIDLQTFAVVDEFPGPNGPDDMEVLADGKTILVTSRWAGKLTKIDTVSRKVIQQVSVGKSPHGVWTLDHMPRQ
ncbi:YncE family protein [Roseateles koreensis]|uniref:YncE family protein n=1 Tax=Roseateles koreensis TaxID=2987526 RepID=A0ABT5KUW9_9BURK|nr:YncE family protein [Roseateles koreensis]MDC8786733.1 YncE family protein [Roseateles koreensis]